MCILCLSLGAYLSHTHNKYDNIIDDVMSTNQ